MENVELLVNLPDFLKELKDFQAIGKTRQVVERPIYFLHDRGWAV